MIRVAFADDHTIIRDGLATLAGATGEMQVIAPVGTAAGALRVARELQPDVLVLDVGLPDGDGVDLLSKLDLPVVILTARASADLARRALDAGALGYVVKTNPFDELAFAIRSAARGQTFISPSIAGAPIRSPRPDPAGA